MLKLRGVNHSVKSCATWTEITINPNKSLDNPEISEISGNKSLEILEISRNPKKSLEILRNL